MIFEIDGSTSDKVVRKATPDPYLPGRVIYHDEIDLPDLESLIELSKSEGYDLIVREGQITVYNDYME